MNLERLLLNQCLDALSNYPILFNNFSSVSKADVMQRVNLVPLRRLDNSRTVIMDNVIKPFLETHPEFYVHKNQILEFEDYEFYVKYSRPFFGKVTAETEIKIDSSTPKAV